MNIELLSIDLSNYCSKQCTFCYNHSGVNGNVVWTPEEVISLSHDCIENGVKAISLGGGEPFEYDGIFQIIDAIQPIAYLSVTTNGLPLLNKSTWQTLVLHRPDKIHITIHKPDDHNEVQRVLRQIVQLKNTGITVGVNLLVSSTKLNSCRKVYSELRTELSSKHIIIVPKRYSETPSPKDLAFITNNVPFQAPSCILGCKPPENFCSISWDKKVNFCSYAKGKQPLDSLTFQGIIDALDRVEFQSCANSYNYNSM